MIDPWSNVRNYLPKSEMSRRTILAALAGSLIWATPAAAQMPPGYMDGKPVAEQQVDLTRYSVWPGHLPKPPPPTPVALPAKPAPGAIAVVTHAVIKPHVIGYDPGGYLTEYVKRYEMLFAQGNDIEIRGSCESACTLVMSVIPKKRLCFGDIAMLRFHKARTTDGNPSSHATQWMVDSYPGDIRSWIEIMGGVEKMPAETHWTMPAPMLWNLGYRRCS